MKKIKNRTKTKFNSENLINFLKYKEDDHAKLKKLIDKYKNAHNSMSSLHNYDELLKNTQKSQRIKRLKKSQRRHSEIKKKWDQFIF